jgi:DNA-binding NarL/FixJ family response regulator
VIKPKPSRKNASPRLDELAELLSEGMAMPFCAMKMGIKQTDCRLYLHRITQRLGKDQCR